MTGVLVICLSQVSTHSGAGGPQAAGPLASGYARELTAYPRTAPDPSGAPKRGASGGTRGKCSATHAVAFYAKRIAYWRSKMGAGTSLAEGLHEAKAACPRYLAHVLQRKAYAARRQYEAMMRDIASSAVAAIRYVFREYAWQALRVAQCESGLSRHAHNGAYLGMFQMGESERRIYGHGDTFLEQAQAAWRYFVASGRDWSPWSCRWAAGR